MSEPSQTVNPHSLTAKILHWGFIGIFAYALTKQLDDVGQLEDFSLLQVEMAFASIFLIILLAPYVFMRLTRPTALPSDAPKLKRVMARTGHLAMYISLSMIAVTGLIIGGLIGQGSRMA